MKDCITCKYGYEDEQLGIPMCHHPSRFSDDCVDFNMHEEKEEPEKATGIEEKKLPEDLEEAAEKYRRETCNEACKNGFLDNYPSPSIKTAFIAGAKWDRAKMMKKAVAVEVVGDKRDLRLINSTERCLFNAKRGDWLKVIVIPEE